jgi:hypothetical protein
MRGRRENSCSASSARFAALRTAGRASAVAATSDLRAPFHLSSARASAAAAALLVGLIASRRARKRERLYGLPSALAR